MQFGNMTYQEIKIFADEGALVIVPTGCTEQQGPHLPVDFDTWLAENIAFAAAEIVHKEYGIDVLVLPALPFGPTPEHRNYGSGFIDLPEDIHYKVILAELQSLADQGFQKIILWQGCGGHHLDNLVDEFNQNQEETKVYKPEQDFQKIWNQYDDPMIPGGHADSFTTSMAMYKRPEAVRENLIANPKNNPVDWDDPELDFSKYSKTGVIGDPTHASPALGKRLWNAVTDQLANYLKEIE